MQSHNHDVVYTPNSANLGLNPGATGYKITWSSGGDQSLKTTDVGGGNSQNLQPYVISTYLVKT